MTVQEVQELLREDQKAGDVSLLVATPAMLRAMGWRRRERRKYSVIEEDLPGQAILWFFSESGGMKIRVIGVDHDGMDSALLLQDKAFDVMERLTA